MTGSPLASLRRIATAKPPPPPGERCEMCAEPVPADHRHVVDLHSRALMCTCRGCHLLFSDPRAEQRYRAIPDRYLSFPGFRLDRTRWDELQIPVGLAFLFTNSTVDRTVAFYPSPAGATESELYLEAWNELVAANPILADLAPEVEALVVNRLVDPHGFAIVPIDRCYELVGMIKATWEGISGGDAVQNAVEAFFARLPPSRSAA